MEVPKQSAKSFRPYQIQDSSALTPDTPQFYKYDVNLMILTKYGRGIYIRHGNQDRCSSFFATLGTIVNKLEMSFGKEKEGVQEAATLKCIRHGGLTLFLLRRLNFMYICWAKGKISEITLYAMMELVHQQLQSCLTGKVNAILDTNQTYDPSVNFGKTKTEHTLLHFAFTNGLHSIPIAFNAIPVMPLPTTARNSLYFLLKQQKIQGLQISILMTMGEIVCIHKQKGIDLTTYDIFLLNVLIQSQSTLFNAQIWYPICLPGICFEDRVFCYINFLSEQLIHVMVSDEAGIFPELSEASKKLKERIGESGLLERINMGVHKELISDPTLEKSQLLKHFVLRLVPSEQGGLGQMVMSSGCYFGLNNPQTKIFFTLYAQLHQHYVKHRTGKKEKVHIQPLGQYVGGYCEESGVAVFFIGSGLCELEDCRQMGVLLSRYVKDEESSLWLK